MKISKKALVLGGVAIVAAAGFTTVAVAQNQTPKNWNYEIKDGKRVPKADRVTKADGSWREEVRQGNCVTVKERSAPASIRKLASAIPKDKP